ncbi:MAG: MMPL family transporter [Methanomassiliicoccales archaeon]|nr:MMPL family transporter [Methanomassiliicoccales archaeon]
MNPFRRLGKFINRRSKLIVVAWIILLLIALPIAPMVKDVVDYTMDSSGTEDLPSVVAQRYINQNFGGTSSSMSGSIILIDAQPQHIFDQDIKLAVLNLTHQIQQASADGTIKANATITSIYSALYDYSVIYIEQIAPLYSLASNLSVGIPLFLFQVPIGYWESFNNTQDTLLMEYGVPKLYYDTWLVENMSGGSIAQIDNRTYNSTQVAIEEIILHRPSLNATEIEMLWTYYRHFTAAWNSTSSDPVYYLHPAVRLDKAMADGYSGFIVDPFIVSQGFLVRLYLTVVHESFNLSNYTDFHRISHFNDVIFRTILDAILSLLPSEIKDDCLLYYDTFYSQWNASSAAPTVQQFRQYATFAATTTQQAAGPPVSDLIEVYYFELGWEQRDNLTAIHQLTVQFLGQYTETQPWLVQTIIDLGSSPNLTAVKALSGQIILNSTVPSFPLPVLPLIPIMLVGGANQSSIMMVSFSHDGKVVSGVNYVTLLRQYAKQDFAQTQATYYVTGMDPMTYDQTVALNEDLAIIDPVAIILILVLIGLFFSSPLAAGLPPAAIGMGLGISFAALYIIAAYVFSVNFMVITLMITASLGAGCDYCIFLLSRYREERRNGRTKEDAVEEAVTWAGETVATSATTVIIAFGALFLASMDIVRSFGTLAIGIILALMIALTLIPALLSIFGDKIFWPSKSIRPATKLGIRYFTHAADFSMKHAKVLLVAALLVSVPAIYVVATTPTSFDLVEVMPASESKAGIESMEQTFGGGMVQPTIVGLNMTSSVYLDNGDFNITMLNSIEDMSKRLAEVPGIGMLLSPTRPFGVLVDYANLSTQYTVEAAQALAVMHVMIGTGNNSAMVAIIFQEDPFSQQAMSSILEIRSIASTVDQQEADINAAYVGGGTAIMYDFASTMSSDFVKIIGFAILFIFVVLMFVLGSVLNPLRSIVTILMSIFWTLVITGLVFQWGMGMYLNFEVPLILLVVCLGLGMDYDILLSTRIREEAHKGMSTNEAIKHSLLQTGGIITACGVVMASAFGSLILTGNPMLMQFGLALMVAILLDATVVRTYLVPAIMSLLGKWNWWAPKWVQRKSKEKEESEKRGA